MRNVIITYDGQQYRVVVRDDHPALIFDQHDELVSSIWPFHSERQAKSSIIEQAVQEHLAQLRPVTSITEPDRDA